MYIPAHYPVISYNNYNLGQKVPARFFFAARIPWDPSGIRTRAYESYSTTIVPKNVAKLPTCNAQRCPLVQPLADWFCPTNGLFINFGKTVSDSSRDGPADRQQVLESID